MQCNICKYYGGGPNNICEAYPDGIPEELLTGEESHREPYPGDRGIQFEVIPKYKDLA